MRFLVSIASGGMEAVIRAIMILAEVESPNPMPSRRASVFGTAGDDGFKVIPPFFFRKLL